MDVSKVNIKPFDGHDFTLWKWQVETYLKAANLEKVVKERAENEAAPTAEEENKFNLILSQSMTRDQLIHVVSLGTGKEKWDRLKAIHQASSADMVQTLYADFFALAPEEGSDIAVYVSRLQSLVFRLKELREDVQDTLVVAHILSKLPPQYATFVVSWHSTPVADRTMDNLTNRLLREETRLKAGKTDDEAFLSKTKAGGSGSGSSSAPRRSNDGSKQQFKYKCFGCGRVGHRVADCRDKKKDSGANRSNKGQASGSGSKSGSGSGNGLSAAFSASFLTKGPMKWYMDSGASKHCCPIKEWFINMKPSEATLTLADGRKLPVEGTGTVEVWTQTSNGRIKMPMNNVLFVPGASFCLFSLTALEDKGFQVDFKNGKCYVKQGNDVKAIGRREASLYVMDFSVESCAAMVANDKASLEQWHRRLAHVNVRKVMKAISWTGAKESSLTCEGCIKGKAHRKSFPKHQKERESKPGNLLHADLAGPMRERSAGGARYFLLLKDDCTGMQFVYFLKEKTQVPAKFKEFLADWNSISSGQRVMRLRTDNGSEFTGQQMIKTCADYLIKRETSTPYSPQQNGTIERAIRTVTEAARSMIYGSDSPLYLWAEAVANAVHVLNRIPSYAEEESPMEMLTGQKSDISYIREFGSKAFAHVRDQDRTKWESKARELVLVGYNGGQKSYRLWDPSGRKLIMSRDVTIIEEELQKEMQFPVNHDESEDEGSDHEDHDDDNHDDEKEENDQQHEHSDHEEPVASGSGIKTPIRATKPVPIKVVTSAGEWKATPSRTKYAMGKLRKMVKKDYKETKTYERQKRASDDDVEPCSTHYAALAFMLTDEPADFNEAMESDDKRQWAQAMDEEMAALEKTKTWSLVKRTPDMNVVKNKWVFRIKRKGDGSIDRYRARLVAKGFSQKAGIDYKETFSPVARYDTIRTMLSLVPAFNLKVTQFDVKTAFLNGELEEAVFMELPEGYGEDNAIVCRLQKSLYGLKQSPRQWNMKVTEVLAKFGLQVCISDPCVYVNGSKTVIVCLYVDDGLIFWAHEKEKDRLVAGLEEHFDISIGDSSSYAGMQIEYVDGQVFVHQENYLHRVLQRFNMDDCKPASCPADPQVKLIKCEDHDEVDVPYRELVGSLMYLAVVSRPDIAYAVSVLSQYMSKFNNNHWTAGKRVLRYLKANPKLGLKFDGTDVTLTAYCDADYAGDIESRRSRSGSVLLFNGSAIIWSSQLQPIVTLSSAEAEFVAANSAVTSIKWIAELLREVGVKLDGTTLLVDNQAAIKMIKNPEFHLRTKHIDIRYKYIRERFQEGLFELQFCRSEDQLADFLTKPLQPRAFKKNVIQIMTA